MHTITAAPSPYYDHHTYLRLLDVSHEAALLYVNHISRQIAARRTSHNNESPEQQYKNAIVLTQKIERR